MKAVRLFQRGLRTAQIARTLGVKRQSVHVWRQAWEKGGKGSLASAGKPGPKAKVEVSKRDELVKVLVEDLHRCIEARYPWTLGRARAIIFNFTGQHYTRRYLGKLLHGYGFRTELNGKPLAKGDPVRLAQWAYVPPKPPPVEPTPEPAPVKRSRPAVKRTKAKATKVPAKSQPSKSRKPVKNKKSAKRR